MSNVPALLEIPRNALDWSRFSFNVRACSDEIRQAVQSQLNQSLPAYPLDPINFNAFIQWLEFNQQDHNNWNSALDLQGVDLESVDIKDEHQLDAWVFLNYQEIYSARSALRI